MKKKGKQKSFDAKNTKPQAKKLNPFEVHINRKKYDILGMKSKSERGLPGISRAKSLKKRKGTLLQEYKFKDKKNTFLDRRIGERNKAMTAEDKILARYAAERMKFHSKKSIYNLGDDEELTHRGQTLTEIEKFDNPKSDDEDEEEEGDGKLDSDFVGDAHFGGGIFKKVEGESKSRKDLIDQLIAESIKRKAEKQKLKQQTLDLTQKLDSDWKELLPLVTASKKSKSDPEPEDKKDDKFSNYDIMSRKLKFEARGKPSDRLKSEEEIAKEEKEKLEQLEKERLQRMRGETEVKKVKHRSADDLDDGFDLSNEPETYLTYKNGVLNIEGKDADSNSENEVSNENCGEKNKSDEEEMDVDEDNKVSDDDDDDDDVDDDEDEEDENIEDDSDNFSDLKDSDDDNNEEENDDHKVPSKAVKEIKQQEPKTGEILKAKSNNCVKTGTTDKDIDKDALQKAKALEAARSELPYTFKIPKDYDEFEELMKNYNSDFQAVIIERMIKCHHPSLKEDFKNDLDILYTFMLQHLQDYASDYCLKVNCFKILDRLSPWFYDLTQWNPQNCSSGLIEVIKEKYEDFLKTPKVYPSLDTLVFLKLASILFPTSDYRHPVVTPSLVFMQQILFQCRVRSSVDISRGLFVTTLLLEYCSLSRKFVPETINFLRGVLSLAHPKTSSIPIEPPFDTSGKEPFSLVVSDKSSQIKAAKLSAGDLINENTSDEFKVNAVNLALKLLSCFCDFWSEDQPAILIFQPFVKLLEDGDFPECLRENITDVLGKIMKMKNTHLKMLVLEKKKPMPLRLYEPKIEQVYSLKTYRPMGKEKAERAKLMHKYKREMKGALREIRRDRSFIAKLKFKDTVKSDMERQRKVREIFGSAAEQAGELNKLQRKKKK